MPDENSKPKEVNCIDNLKESDRTRMPGLIPILPSAYNQQDS